MKDPIRIILAEDHRILREALRVMLCNNSNLTVAAEAQNGSEAVRLAEKTPADLMIIDLSMPMMDGLSAISEIKKKNPDIKILVLTVHKAEEYVFEALNAGADGYLLKDAGQAELKLAIENVVSGRFYISPGISDKLVSAFLNRKIAPEKTSAWDNLTHRERQILKLVAEGMMNKEIAEYLCISIKTVEKHRSNLMKKLDLHSASELTAFAFERGMVAR